MFIGGIGFMKAILKKKEEVAKLTCYAEFEVQGERPTFETGQYFYVTLRPEDTEHQKELTHHISIVNSPNEKGILALTTRLRLKESLFKRTLNEMQLGEEVEIGKIAGEFVLPDSTDRPVVFIALGIGITPYRSMLRWALEENKPYNFTLIYSDDEIESMAFLEELKQMEKEHSDNFRIVQVVTKDENWQGEKRRVDANFIKHYFDDITKPLYYISGPPKAVFAVRDNFKEAGIPEDQIKADDFYGY
jgi:ferredoxin-NADP reductase